MISLLVVVVVRVDHCCSTDAVEGPPYLDAKNMLDNLVNEGVAILGC